nr:MAG TPA: hypothetical protein [Crassvirales sp.]
MLNSLKISLVEKQQCKIIVVTHLQLTILMLYTLLQSTMAFQ